MSDPLLVSLVLMAEAKAETPIEHDVTLVVGGFLISGFVVSFEKWMQHHHTVKTIFGVLEKSRAGGQDTDDNVRGYIHLRDAKYFVPGQRAVPANVDIYCRIPLNAVQGFSFGKLSAD